jgi:hypothetical protein
MIMPANYSVIAENELTYVDGGAGFHFYVNPIDDGGELMATNLVKYIGAAYLGKVMEAVINPWFQADTSEKAIGIKGTLKENIKGLFTLNNNSTRTLDKVQYGISNTIGVASALWVLGTQSDVVSTKDAAGTLTL